jgi:predicted PurR-regulated permease PerM
VCQTKTFLCVFGLWQIVFGTFIVSFIGNSFVANTQTTQVMQSAFPNQQTRRRVLVVIYFLCILSVVMLFGLLTIPDIAKEGAEFVSRLQSDNIWVILVEKTRHGLG